MTIRRFAGALGSLLLTFGIGAIAPATGRAQTTLALPGEHSEAMLTGCFGWINGPGYVLTSPTMGQVSVPQETCLVSESGPMVKLRHDLKKNGLSKTMLGRFVQVSGRMGDSYENRKHRPDRLRTLYVESVAVPPVTPPVVAEITREPVMPAPAPPTVAPAPAPIIIEQPVGTTGVMKKRHHLPKTASTLPLVGLIGFMALMSGLTLHVFGQRSLRRG
jgi:hypothetical protein